MGLDSILNVSGPALWVRVPFRHDTHQSSFLYHSSFVSLSLRKQNNVSENSKSTEQNKNGSSGLHDMLSAKMYSSYTEHFPLSLPLTFYPAVEL